jgi:hypothetical protein
MDDYGRLLKKGSECFECLSMNGKIDDINTPSVCPEPVRRTPREDLQQPARLHITAPEGE